MEPLRGDDCVALKSWTKLLRDSRKGLTLFELVSSSCRLVELCAQPKALMNRAYE